MLNKVIQTSLNFLLKKESLEKKTSKNFKMKVNSILKFDYYIKNNRNIRTAGFISSFLLILLFALSIYPISASSEYVEALAGTATASTTSLDMTLDHSAANVDLVIRGESGTFAASADNDLASFNIITNNFTGYTLNISAANNTGELVNSTTSTSLSSIASFTDADTFTNGSAALYNGKWGYKPSKYNSTTNTYYRPAPSMKDSNNNIVGDTLDTTSTANNEANTYTIGIGARADMSTLAGTYTGTFILEAVGNPAEYTISYADNSGDSTVTGSPINPSSATTGSTTDATITLTTDTPTRDKYKFVSWCLGESGLSADEVVTDEGTVCHGTEYDSGADFGIDQTTQNITTLYAVWEESYEGYLQDFTASQCAAMEVQSTKILRDTRDNQDYTIAKLADGNCWMDNLNLGDTDNYPLVATNLDSSNTHVDSSTSIAAATWNDYKKTAGAGTFTAVEYISVFGTDSTSGAPYGTLYNYCAASAGTICTSSNPSDVSYDICPKGWRLPTGGSSGEFQALYNNSSYNSLAKMRASIANDGTAFALAGGFTNGTPTLQGSQGSYWSSTRDDNAYMYHLSLSAYNVSPATSSGRDRGYSIRCILQNPLDLAGVKTMQDIGRLSASEKSALLESLPEDTSYPISDSRDNQIYYVAKLKDGNLWMTQNLKLGKSTTSLALTASDSDVPSSGFTLTNKSSDGKFTNAGGYNNDNSQYYCTDAYGCYYNWYTATASSGSSATTSGNVDYSICPKGWTLPTGGSGGQFERLTTLYGGTGSAGATAMLVSPTSATENTSGLAAPGFLLGGHYSSSASNVGSDGYYWPRTAASAALGYLLDIHPTSVYPVSNSRKYIGNSVRCLMDNLMAENGVETMQDLGNLSISEKNALLDKMPTGTSYTLEDSRDGEQYAVAKLADGNLWLLDNLRLGSATLKESLSTANTNMSSSVAFTLPSSSSSGFTSYGTAMINTASANITTTSYGSGSGKIGVYYNYCAASAGTYCYAEGYGTGNASYDICSKGWRMPTGGPSGEYQALYTAYGSNATNFRNALSTPLSGTFSNSSASYQGSLGIFWSSTYYNGSNMHSPSVGSSGMDPANNYGRYYGYSVRCVLEKRTVFDKLSAGLLTMQDIGTLSSDDYTSLTSQMADGTSYNANDSRDRQTYSIAKINGNLWMTRNLAIGCAGTGSTYSATVSSKSLTATDSNVSTSWSTPTTSLTSGNSYDDPRMTCSSAYGAWYNYAAATAGTITGDSNTTEASYSVCPAGWRLPTNSEQIGIASQSSAFSPITSGFYRDGSLHGTGSDGFWWSSTAKSTANRYNLYWDGSSLDTTNVGTAFGSSIRCVRS